MLLLLSLPGPPKRLQCNFCELILAFYLFDKQTIQHITPFGYYSEGRFFYPFLLPTKFNF